VNRLLVRKAVPGFTTVFLARYDPGSGHLAYCSSGHPEPIVCRASGEVVRLRAYQPPLGVFPDQSYCGEGVSFGLGDLLFLYTDGLTEARSKREMFGDDRLVEALRSREGVPLDGLPAFVLNRVFDFSLGRLRDDAAVLVIEPL
jgi:sigma-B regulation protein RsbU (phosphoserine phosphatase)